MKNKSFTVIVSYEIFPSMEMDCKTFIWSGCRSKLQAFVQLWCFHRGYRPLVFTTIP